MLIWQTENAKSVSASTVDELALFRMITFRHKIYFLLHAQTNLITVPSCDECNGGSSKDDEYFRLWLVSRENTKGHPARDTVFPTMQRSLRRKAAPSFAKAFWRKLTPAERRLRSA